MDASFICCCCCSDLLCRNEMQKMGGGDRLSALQSLLQIQLVPMANKGKYGIMSIKRLQRHFASRNDHLSTNLFKYMLTLLELNEDSCSSLRYIQVHTTHTSYWRCIQKMSHCSSDRAVVPEALPENRAGDLIRPHTPTSRDKSRPACHSFFFFVPWWYLLRLK